MTVYEKSPVFLTDKEKALENIKYYLSKLSMVRVVKTKADERSELKTNYLNTWPLFYDNIYIDAVEYAKSRGALQEREFYVRSFSVNRDDYDNFANRKEPSNKANKLKNKISLLRSYIEILRVVEKIKSDGENISLTIGYDTEKTPTDLLPTNTENLNKIINIKNNSDIFYGFSTDSGWRSKLKSRDGCFLFHKLGLFKNKSISIINRDLLQSTSEKKGRILVNNRAKLEAVFEKSQENIFKTVGKESWYTDLQNYR